MFRRNGRVAAKPQDAHKRLKQPRFGHKTARLTLLIGKYRAHIANARPDRVLSGRNGRFVGGLAAADGLQ